MEIIEEKMNSNRRKLLYYLVGIVYFAIFLYFVTAKLVIGGRWSIGMMLGGADNWLRGGSMYTLPEKGLSTGSLYSPGGSFLAIIARMLFDEHAETAMILTGGLFAVLMIWAFTTLEAKDKKQKIENIFACATLFLFGFGATKAYLFELHPDIPALTCFAFGVILLNNFLCSKRLSLLVFATLLFFCSGLFKANAFFLFVGLGIYTLISKTEKKDKLIIILSETISGIGVLLVMLAVDGCWYNCVVVMSTHYMVDFAEYINYILGSKTNLLFPLLLLLCIWLRAKYNIGFVSRSLEMWMYASISWCAFGFYGAAKIGSNAGNIEASLVALLPFVIPVVVLAFNKCREFVMNILFIHKTFETLLYFLLVIILLFVFIISSIRIANNLNLYVERKDKQEALSRWLRERYPECNVAYCSDTYEIVNNAGLNKKSDLTIAGHYANGHLLNDDDLHLKSQKEEWKVIVTISSEIPKMWPKTFSNYEKLSETKYPVLMTNGEPIDIFVVKTTDKSSN